MGYKPDKHEFDSFNDDLTNRAKIRHKHLDETSENFERQLKIINFETCMDIIDVSRETLISAFIKDFIQFQELKDSGRLTDDEFDYYLTYSEMLTSKKRTFGYSLVEDYDHNGPKGDVLRVDMDFPEDIALNDQADFGKLKEYVNTLDTIYFRLTLDEKDEKQEEMYVVADKGIKKYNPISHQQSELDEEYILFINHVHHLQLEYLEVAKTLELWERFSWMKLYPQKTAQIKTK